MLCLHGLQQGYGLANTVTRALFDEINAHPAQQGLLIRAGTNVDAPLIAAPTSTKIEGPQRDPEMHQAEPLKAGVQAKVE